MVMSTGLPQGTRVNPRFTLEVTPGMSIANAIANADALGGDWTILLYPGTYNEGDLAPTGGADITIQAMGEGRVVITPAVLPAVATIVSAHTLALKDITVTAFNNTVPALAVTGSICGARNCSFDGAVGGDSIDVAAGTLDLNHCSVDEDIELHMNPCTLLAWDCDLDAINTAAEVVAHVIRLNQCDLGGAVMALAATGACTYEFHNCMEMSTITDASLLGTGHLCQCDVVGAGLVVNGTSAWIVDKAGLVAVSNTDATTTATIAIYGGVVLAVTRAVGSVVWWLDDTTLKVIPSQTATDRVIQWAVNAADAATGPIIILVYAGVYNEGEITPAGTADITIKGMGEGRVQIVPTAIPATGTFVSGHTLCLENLTITAFSDARTAITVNGGTLTIETCFISGITTGDAIAMIAGQINAYRTRVLLGDIDLSTDDCILNMYFCQIVTDPIDTAGNLAHQIWLEHCNLNNQGVASAATGATTLRTYGCSHLGLLANAGTGNWECRLSDVGGVNFTGTGTLTLFGGDLGSITRAAVSVVWWHDSTTIDVLPSGTVTDTMIGYAVTAANAAGGNITIRLHAGTYRESVTLLATINLVGIDKDDCLIDVTDGNTGFTMAEGCRVANITLVVTASGGNSIGIDCNDAAFTIENLNITLTRTGGNAYAIYENTGATARVIYIRNVRIAPTDLVETNETGIRILRAGKTLHIEESWILGGDYGIFCDAASTFHIDNTYVNVIVDPPGGGMTIYCAAATMSFRTCTIEKQITAGNLGIIRLKNSSYREINRTGTGNIVDESPGLKDAPWHVEKWDWQAALAQSQVAVRGTPVDAGSGQIQLEVTDNAAGQEAVEALPVAAGALANTVLPARTPRCLMQIAHDGFDAHTTAFYGLRETLGNDIPNVAAEECAGFDWDGTDFRAISSDGVTGEVTDLATPTIDTHVQLEVIVFGGHSVEFYVDGILVATHDTSPDGIPAAVLNWQHLLETAGGGGGDVVQATVRNGGVVECPA